MRVVADRIGVFARRAHQFQRARNELPRDRIVRIFSVDQAGDIGRHGDGIARGDPFEVGEIGSLRQPALDELGGLPQRCRQFRIDPVHGSPAGGVHTT